MCENNLSPSIMSISVSGGALFEFNVMNEAHSFHSSAFRTNRARNSSLLAMWVSCLTTYFDILNVSQTYGCCSVIAASANIMPHVLEKRLWSNSHMEGCFCLTCWFCGAKNNKTLRFARFSSLRHLKKAFKLTLNWNLIC